MCVRYVCRVHRMYNSVSVMKAYAKCNLTNHCCLSSRKNNIYVLINALLHCASSGAPGNRCIARDWT